MRKTGAFRVTERTGYRHAVVGTYGTKEDALHKAGQVMDEDTSHAVQVWEHNGEQWKPLVTRIRYMGSWISRELLDDTLEDTWIDAHA